MVSCMVKAENPEKNIDLTASLEAALIVQAESELVLEDWMLDPVYIEKPAFPITESLLTAQNSR